jgi:acyl dehydratase
MNLEGLGRYVGTEVATAATTRIALYAKVTADRDSRHLEGILAPPLFSALLVHESVKEAVRQLIGPELASQCLHGEHLVQVLAPLAGEDIVRVRASALAIRPTRAGTVIIIRGEVTSGARRDIAEHYFTSILPGKHLVQEPHSVTERLPSLVANEDRVPLAPVSFWVPDDITFLYAEVSGDHHPYHVDKSAAQAAGFPSTIVHGLCTLALTASSLSNQPKGTEGREVGTLGARFAAPLFPGQRATVRRWVDSSDPDRLYFEVVDESETVVLKSGYVHFRAEPSGAQGA